MEGGREGGRGRSVQILYSHKNRDCSYTFPPSLPPSLPYLDAKDVKELLAKRSEVHGACTKEKHIKKKTVSVTVRFALPSLPPSLPPSPPRMFLWNGSKLNR